METITIRIRLKDWKKIKKSFPSYDGETAHSYFFRLREYLEKKNLKQKKKSYSVWCGGEKCGICKECIEEQSK